MITTTPNAFVAPVHNRMAVVLPRDDEPRWLSAERTHDVRHVRLNTQGKLHTALWCLWLRREPFDPERFFPTTDPKTKAGGRSPTKDADG